MFHRSRWAYPCILAILALAPFTGAMSAPAPAPVIGVLDRQVVEKEYLGYKSLATRMQHFVEVRQNIYQSLIMGVGLSQDDFKEYERLTKYEIVIDAERVATFRDVAKKNMALHDALQEKKGKEGATLTDDEEAQLQKLASYTKTAVAIINDRKSMLVKEIQAENDRLAKTIDDMEAKVIEKIAKQKKLGIVLNRGFQTEKGVLPLVLWSSDNIDITSDVIKLLNAEFKETLLDAPIAQPAPPATVPAPPAAN